MNFTVYRSSAGSGKTFTLVKEYLRIVLLEPQRFRSILAITFTNKSAAEMKDRVLTALRDLSDADPEKLTAVHKNMLPQLVKETKLSKDEIALRAADTLSQILHNYSDFAITTIDSFIHRIIRTFSFDLHLPANFDVEIAEDQFIERCVDLLVSKAGSDDDLTRVLVEFSQGKADDEKSFNIEGDILKMALSITKEDTQIHLDRLSQLSLQELLEIRSKLIKQCKLFENEVTKTAAVAVKIIEDNGIDIEWFYQGNRGIGKYFTELAEGNIEKIVPNSYVADTIDNEKWTGGKCPKDKGSLIKSISPKLIDVYQKLEEIRERGYGRYKIFGLIRDSFYPLALLNEVNKVVNEMKAEENLILISEFNRLIANIVLKEPVPFIYERLGVRFKHFLIDEFQDTSIMQWQNLLPLVENGLSEDRFSMVVGDGKQAIYRWRNGEVEQFDKLPKIFKKPDLPFYDDREDALVRNYQSKQLDSNFRSGAEIVKFNNTFFRFLSQSLDPSCQSIYETLEQQPNPSHPGGYIHIEFPPLIETGTEMFDRTTEIIAELKKDNFQYSDIAIICRANDKASDTARHLLRNGIPVLSAESLLLNGAPEVNFMLACLRYLTQPSDFISRTEMIRFLHYRKMLGNEGLHTSMRSVLPTNHPKNLFDASTIPAEGFLSFLKRSGFDLSPYRLVRLPLYDLCEELMRMFKLHNPANPYLLFFLDAVNDYSSKKTSDIFGFLDWWDEEGGKRSIIVPEGVDAVRIMTIHKSKGLEFPVVIYPFADQEQRATLDKVWVDFEDKELPGLTSALLPVAKKLEGTAFEDIYQMETAKSRLDFINLFYVTMTRPIDRLYVLAGQASKDTSKMKSVPDIFMQYFNSLGIAEEGKIIYTFGKTERSNDNEEKGRTISITPAEFISAPWQHRMRLSLQAPKIWDIDDPDRNRAWGNLLHTALSMIKTNGDIERVTDLLLMEGRIGSDKKDALQEILYKIVEQPELQPLFSHSVKVLTEAEILTPSGKSYRPDRVVITEDIITIIDYKTGKPSPDHKKQLDQYALLLAEMNYNTCEKLLVYIDDEIKVEKL